VTRLLSEVAVTPLRYDDGYLLQHNLPTLSSEQASCVCVLLLLLLVLL
jgi:hypothetical protein